MSSRVERIRNIGIVAHIDAGKTTTTERILYYTGATHLMGEVDKGTTKTDFDVEEARRGITIYAAAVTCHWDDVIINLIDTPGHVDFTAEVERSLRVLDGAVVIFSAVEGVEAQSETVWRQADRYHVPRICFINKMDRVGASFERTFEEMGPRLGAHPVALQIPIGAGAPPDPDAFRGVIDLIDQQALYFDPETRGERIERREIPPELVETAAEWRKKLLEAVALLDDDVLTTYMETDDIPKEDIHRVLRAGTLNGQLQPTLCGSSLHCIGVQPVLDAVARYLPSPLDRPPIEGRHPNPKKTAPEIRRPSPDEPFCGLLFKIQIDRHGELDFVRIYSGVLKSGARVLNSRTGTKELVNKIWRVQADARERVEEDRAEAGDIVGVVGLKDSVTGDTLCDPHRPIVLESITFPETVISMAIEPESSADRKRLEDTLLRLARQDPTFDARIDEETGQTIVSGMGELHLEVIRERLKRDFGLGVRVHKPRVTYRETVRNAVEVVGEFSRQTGNVSHFARVKMKIEPHEGEEAVTVRNLIKPGTLPDALLQTLQQAVLDEARGGGSLGFPLFHVAFTLLDVDYREGETTDVALQAAAVDAVRKGLEQAGIVLLEPVMRLEVVTPEEFVGPIQADLNTRRAVVVKSERRGDLYVLQAEVPLAEMFGYSTQVRSLSQGRASYTMEPLKYAPAPQEKLEAILG